MHILQSLAVAALCATVPVAHAAGLRFIEVPADAQGPAIKAAVWSPCDRPAGRVDMGPDRALAASPVAAAIDADRIGLFGFSRGGYTGLVVIGANPDWAGATEACRAASNRACQQILAKEYPTEPLMHDPRIKAAGLADPLAVTFPAASLAPIKVPVQLWQSERGGDGVLPHDVAQVDRNLPVAHEYRVVRNAGHLAFLAPCPQVMTAARPDLCVDQAGLDRVAFHQELNSAVLAFFRQHLARD